MRILQHYAFKIQIDPQSDFFLNKMKTMSSNQFRKQFNCYKCEVELCDEDVLKKHEPSNDESELCFECNKCDGKFIDS